jgi:hypothetical protein
VAANCQQQPEGSDTRSGCRTFAIRHQPSIFRVFSERNGGVSARRTVRAAAWRMVTPDNGDAIRGHTGSRAAEAKNPAAPKAWTITYGARVKADYRPAYEFSAYHSKQVIRLATMMLAAACQLVGYDAETD